MKPDNHAAVPKTCPIDGRPLTRPATGRPPVYCSVACRRVAEAELRRIDRRIASLESDRDSLAVAIAAWSVGPLGKSDGRQLAAIEAAIAKAVERQRSLFEQLSPEEETADDR